MQHVAWPWTAAAWAALGRSEFSALLSLAGWTLLAGMVRPHAVRAQPALRRGGSAGHAAARTAVSTMQAAAEAFYRLPARWLRDPLAAIVEKELRSLARTPRYRMVFVMGFSFGLMVWLPMILGRPRRPQHRVVASFPDRGLRLCAHAAGSGLLLELFRLRPFGGADLLRRAAAAGQRHSPAKTWRRWCSSTWRCSSWPASPRCSA